ncbi:unnamed protein product [Phytomonas sp. Hart1]|nr:unnamed protein product [Phytomonas sp. Hart1]|eukprot:CCW70945.1 unnamed protein product [Phytomonas sp. isolate Hart1]
MANQDRTQGQLEQKRCGCPIYRAHKRFLLKTLCFTQQYASMYRCRMKVQYGEAIAAIREAVKGDPDFHSSDGLQDTLKTPKRVLELAVGVPSLCAGVLYKQMKHLPRFLDKYQQELVRIDAGDYENDAEAEGMTELLEEMVGAVEDGGPTRVTAGDHPNPCSSMDELTLEDSSGRVVLHGLPPGCFCTGIILGIYGTLQPNGTLQVHKYAFASVRKLYVARTLMPGVRLPPCYIAFVCCLNVDLPSFQGKDGENGDVEEALRAQLLLELLVDFIEGNVSDPEALDKSRYISRLVIGGNSIAPTEELKLRSKIMLDHSDQKRLNDKTNTGLKTSTMLMQKLDGILAQLAGSVEVELMPGDNDPSNTFQPQQPLHPLLLPNASRYSSLRLVSNPFEFSVLTSQQTAIMEQNEINPNTKIQDSTRSGEALVFVASGQNVNDVARQTRLDSRLEVMSLMVASGCACPTAPNTLFSYPFKDEDPFLFRQIPHCFVACDQPCFETRYVRLAELERESTSYDGSSTYATRAFSTTDGRVRGSPDDMLALNEEEDDNDGVRLICVPSFTQTGTLVLVDVNSPELDAIKMEFSAG